MEIKIPTGFILLPTLEQAVAKAIFAETLHFRRKAIPPKKLQRKTIPPGAPHGRLS